MFHILVITTYYLFFFRNSRYLSFSYFINKSLPLCTSPWYPIQKHGTVMKKCLNSLNSTWAPEKLDWQKTGVCVGGGSCKPVIIIDWLTWIAWLQINQSPNSYSSLNTGRAVGVWLLADLKKPVLFNAHSFIKDEAFKLLII